MKFAAIALLLVVNILYLLNLRSRRAHSPTFAEPVHLHEWNVTLSERTEEDRERVLSAAFAISDFDVKPLEGASEVVIPRPENWFEEIIISANYACSQINERRGKKSPGNDCKLPWYGGPVDVAMRSVWLVAYKSEPGPKSNQVLVKETQIGVDTHLVKNGIEVPTTELIAVGRYFVDDNKNKLLMTQRAVQFNGKAQSRYQADVPHWLVPTRKLVVGETWVQHGAHPDGIPVTAPLAEVARKLNRLVVFEGRHAAEIATTATCYEFAPGPVVSYVKRQEQTLCYLDLETGEPLWFEIKDQGEGEFQSVVRGCNQIFVKHLIRTKRKT